MFSESRNGRDGRRNRRDQWPISAMADIAGHRSAMACDNVAGIGDNSAEIAITSQKLAMAPHGSSILPRT